MVMTALTARRSVGRLLPLGLGVAAAAYATYAGVAWFRYGHASRPSRENQDDLLDGFMPSYDIVERHHTRVRAPAETTFAAACEVDLATSPLVRAIFKGRELILRAEPDTAPRPRGLIASAKSYGWGVLGEVPGREIVLGAVTRPWEANVVFRAIPPAEFAAFNEPGYVKIAWTVRADAVSPTDSVFRTETRAVATDAVAGAKFRRYWSLLSPGIIAIRWMMLKPVKVAAELQAQPVM